MKELTLSHFKDLVGITKEAIDGFQIVKINSRKNIYVCLRQSNNITGYEYEKINKKWVLRWKNEIFNFPINRSSEIYPWFVTNALTNGSDVIILRHNKGLRFYQPDESFSQLNLIAEDGVFHDVYGWNRNDHKVLVGDFYPDKNIVGVVGNEPDGKTTFYAVNTDLLFSNERSVLWKLENDLSLNSDWQSVDLSLTRFDGKQQHFVLRNSESLKLYKFNNAYQLEFVSGIEDITKIPTEDYVFFGNLTGNPFKDMIYIDKNGVSVYQYDPDHETFKLFHRQNLFNHFTGWLSQYGSTIQFLDINNDGSEELLFTGSDGLTALNFESITPKWNAIIDPSKMALNKYSKVIGKVTPELLLIQNPEGDVYSTEIVEYKKNTDDKPIEVLKSKNHKKSWTSNKLIPEELANYKFAKPHLRWSEYFDESSIKNPVDFASGQVQFGLKIFDFNSAGYKFKPLMIYYQNDFTSSDIIGRGWSFPLMESYIIVDYKQSIFFEDANFYLYENGRYNLMERTYNDKGNGIKFKLKDSKHEIFYFLSEKVWSIETDGAKHFYGKNDCNYQSLEWPNWRGSGNDKQSQQPMIVAWYLSEHYNKNTTTSLYYNCEKTSSQIPGGKHYDTGIFIKSVKAGDNVEIVFDYLPKSTDEFSVLNPIDQEGNINFPVTPVQNRFLKSCQITTDSYVQNLSFEYEIINSIRFLSSINENCYSDSKKVLQFNYKQLLEKYVMSNLILTEGAVINFNYNAVTLPKLTEVAQVRRLEFNENSKLAHGTNHVVIASAQTGKINIKIMNKDFDEIITDCLAENTFSCPSINSEVLNYTIQAFENKFIVHVITKESDLLYLYSFENNKWSKDVKSFSFPEKTLLRFNDKIVVAINPNRNILELFELNTNMKKSFTVTNGTSDLTIRNYLVVGYDHRTLWWLYKNIEGNWEKESENIDIGNTHRFINTIDLLPDDKNTLHSAFSRHLHLDNNIITINEINDIDGQLYSNIMTILLDRNHKSAKKHTFGITRKNLMKSTTEAKAEDGTTYHMIVYKGNGLYKAKINDITGGIRKKLRNKNRRADYIENLNNDGDMKEFFKQSIAQMVEWSQFEVVATPSGISCGDDVKISFSGSEMRRENIAKPENVSSKLLGKDFVLEIEYNKDVSATLYNQNENGRKTGNPLKTMMIVGNNFIDRHPVYLAYMPANQTVETVIFNGKSFESFEFNNEKLILQSDYENLLTSAENSMVVRPISSLNVKEESPDTKLYVGKMEVAFGETRRLTGFTQSYSFYSKNSTIIEKLELIPANDKIVSGWYEEVNYHNNNNMTTTKNWFDNKGQQQLPPNEDEDNKEDNTTPDSDSTDSKLMDKNSQWLISDFSPYSLNDEMFAYYGFENYEQNKFGFNINGTIIEKSFAFTGENYLKLQGKNNGFIEGKFIPNNQDAIYLAACWLRSSNNKLLLNEPTNHLKAFIKVDEQEIVTLFGQVKLKFNNWNYIELFINLNLFKNAYPSKFVNSNNTIFVNRDELKFSIILKVEPGPDEIIDLDHIRLSPLILDFKATVYHPIIGKPIATIQANGLISRTIYNNYNEKFVDLKDLNQIEEFSSISKTGNFINSESKNLHTLPNQITFKPENGFYENFDEYIFSEHWKVDDIKFWKRRPGKLLHSGDNENVLWMNPFLFDSFTAIRFYFKLSSRSSSMIVHLSKGHFKFLRQGNDSYLQLPDKNQLRVPFNGETIFMIDDNWIWIWVNGVLLVDCYPRNLTAIESDFKILAQGDVSIEDVLVMNNPEIKIEYFNEWGDKIQVLEMEDEENIQITEILYDKLGRAAINTKKTRFNRLSFAYRPNLITNPNPYEDKSVWNTGKLLGEIDRLNPMDRGFAYFRVEFYPNLFNEERIKGLPGFDFSIDGPFATVYSQDSDVSFLKNYFPGRRQKVTYEPDGTKEISIFDDRNNRIGLYTRVPGYDHLLSTYEYDSDNRLIKMLPPLYHERVKTTSKVRYDSNLSNEEIYWQKVLGNFFNYDSNGQLIQKITPDTGVTKLLYNPRGQLKFLVALDNDQKTNVINYFEYDDNDELILSGYLHKRIPVDELQKYYLDTRRLPSPEQFQQVKTLNYHPDPLLRGKVKTFVTYNQAKEPVVENVIYNNNEEIVKKSTLIVASKKLFEMKKILKLNRIHTLEIESDFLEKPFQLVHHYNRLGQLTRIGTPEDPNYFVTFDYNSNGLLESENYHQSSRHPFKRVYEYNSPGLVSKISDPFLSEIIGYENGYAQSNSVLGIVMQTTFNATWPLNSDRRWFRINEELLPGNFSTPCLQSLKRLKYLTDDGRPIKTFLRENEPLLPSYCRGHTAQHLVKLVAEKETPMYYGHKYSYGNHKELVKAKYFNDETLDLISPLQPTSFSKLIRGISEGQSYEIWNLLTKKAYIIADQSKNNVSSAIGKCGISFFNDTKLEKDLKAIDETYVIYQYPLKRLLISLIKSNETITLIAFKEIFSNWVGHGNSHDILADYHEKSAESIFSMLTEKEYFQQYRVFDDNFLKLLNRYSIFITDIAKVIYQHCVYELGEHAFDVDVFKIDANGNHKLYYTGFDKLELIYHATNNQIRTMKLTGPDSVGEKMFKLKHDARGNVIKALHKRINRIIYHPVSQRPTNIHLTDGRFLHFHYDAQGERVLKQVFSPQGKINSEKYYLRDEKGRVLMDHHVYYESSEPIHTTTFYIYGPRGLTGFIRDNTFYQVTTDHAGSVRLVIKAGQVVAAYDYLPYGQLMRTFGTDPKAHIAYLFTGQELDEETALYNFHARLYDPTIGRFLQIDPKLQYFSPYVYAGNSPISIVDPDGEFAFLIAIIVGAVVGAYLGGAAANNRWNPADWDYSDPGTYFGIVGGGLAGGFLPVGFVASAGVIGVGATTALGLGASYLTAAGSNGSFNILKWSLRPETFSSLFQGFGTGSGLFGGINLTHEFASKLAKISPWLKRAFLAGSYGTGLAVGYANAVIANDGNFKLDLSNPATWSAFLDGFDVGMGWPQNIVEIGKGIKGIKRIPKIPKNPKFLKRFVTTTIKKGSLKSLLKNVERPMHKAIASCVMAYFFGSSANEDFLAWDFNSFSTYEGIINGIFFGKDAHRMIDMAKDVGRSKQKLKIERNIKRALSDYPEVINSLAENLKHTEFEHIIEESFKNKDLTNVKLSPEEITEIKRFVELGAKKWKLDETSIPEPLRKFVEKIVDERIRKYEKLNEDVIAEQKAKDEFQTDKEIDAMTCSSKRTKRMAKPFKRCRYETNGRKETGKAELIEIFLDDDVFNYNYIAKDEDQFVKIEPNKNGFDPKYPYGFAENFSMLLDQIPNFLAVIKPEFFPSMLLGNLLTIPYTGLNVNGKAIFVKGRDLEIEINSENKRVHILKTCIVSEENGRTKVIFKTIVPEPRWKSDKMTKTQRVDEQRRIRQNLEKYGATSKNEIDELKLGRENIDIEENIYYINSDNSLSFKKSNRNILDLESNNDFENDFTLRIQEGTDSNNLDVTVEHLYANGNLPVESELLNVHNSVAELSKQILELYENSKSVLNLKDTSEAGFHGFFYGALLSFKNYHNLNIAVERVAGKGYADLILLPRGKMKKWNGVPVVVEFKADRSSAATAVDQAVRKGYLYNLSMRTISNRGIIVGINSRTKDIEIRDCDIPQYKGIVPEIIEGASIDGLESQLQFLYYSTSNMALKQFNGNDHYLGFMVLGELLANPNIEKYVDLNLGDNPMGEIKANPDRENKIFSMVFRKKNAKEWTMMNIIESSKETREGDFIFQDVDIDDKSFKITLPNKMELDSVKRIDIKVNPRSKLGWSKETAKTDGSEFFFQNIQVHDDNVKLTEAVVLDNYVHLNDEIFKGEIIRDKLLPKVDQGDQVDRFDQVDQGFRDLETILQPIKKSINSENDFQGLLHGIFNAKNDLLPINVIKVFPEANLSKGGRPDLIASNIKLSESKNVIKSKTMSVELKFSKGNSANSLQAQGENQQQKRGNYASVTDEGTYESVVATYNQNSGKIQTSYNSVKVSHLSDTDSDSSEPLSRNERSINVENSKAPIIDIEPVSSGSRNLLPWPHNLLKWTTNLMSSYFPPRNSARTKDNLNLNYSTPPVDHPSPSMLLEVGDKLFTQNTNGNLTWAILLLNKITGYTPTLFTKPTIDEGAAIKLDILSASLLDEFMVELLNHANTLQLEEEISQLLNDIELYLNAKTMVRQKLLEGESEKIPKCLVDLLLKQQLHKVSNKDRKTKCQILYRNMLNEIPNLQISVNKQENEWAIPQQQNDTETQFENIYFDESLLKSNHGNIDYVSRLPEIV